MNVSVHCLCWARKEIQVAIPDGTRPLVAYRERPGMGCANRDQKTDQHEFPVVTWEARDDQ